MQELVNSTQKDWLEAKHRAAERCRRKYPEVAQRLEECQMFKGDESLKELSELIFSPQGREFMLANDFPGIETLRKFKPYHPERFGIYIDSGKMEITDPGRCLVAGDTQIRIICRETKANNIILMHGAKADVEASGYSVVRIEKDRTARSKTKIQDHARIL